MGGLSPYIGCSLIWSIVCWSPPGLGCPSSNRRLHMEFHPPSTTTVLPPLAIITRLSVSDPSRSEASHLPCPTDRSIGNRNRICPRAAQGELAFAAALIAC